MTTATPVAGSLGRPIARSEGSITLSPSPALHCPASGAGLDGGPVVFWCAGCGHGFQAADLDAQSRLPVQQGRAV
jgi:hypothetical protein